MYDAESWIVMHYLLHQQKLPETGTYFGLVLNQHVPVEDAIQQAYGVTSTQLEQAVKDYFHAQSAMPHRARQSAPATDTLHPDSVYRFPSPVEPGRFDDHVQTTARSRRQCPLRRSSDPHSGAPRRRTEDSARPGHDADCRSTKRSKPRRRRKSPTTTPANSPATPWAARLAHRILAWDHITHSEFDDAIPELGDAAALNQRDMWVRYYLCALKYRMAQAKHTDIQGLPNMMLDLEVRARMVSRNGRRLRPAGARAQRRRKHARRHAGRARRHDVEPAQRALRLSSGADLYRQQEIRSRRRAAQPPEDQ